MISAAHISVCPAGRSPRRAAGHRQPAQPSPEPRGHRRVPTVRRPRASGTTPERPGSVTSERRRRRPRRVPRRRAGAASEMSAVKVEASARRTSDRSTPDGTSVRSWSSNRGCHLAVAREAMEPRRSHAPLPCQRGIVRRNSAASSRELARRGGRPAGCRVLGGRRPARRRCQRRGRLPQAPGGGHAPPSPSPPRRAHDAPPAASRPALARNRSRRAAGARSERRIIELDHSFVGTGSSAEMTRSRSPCAAATRSTVGRASAATSSRTSRVSARQPGEAAAEQLRRRLGHRQGSAGGRARVRAYELAPQLEREEGIARRRLLHAGELGAGQVEPESLLEQAVQAPPD